MKTSEENVSPETIDGINQKLIVALEKNTVGLTLNRKTIFRNFILGISTAFGATVGLAIVFTILGVFIKLAGGIPVVGEAILRLGEYLHR
jgi:hypothetical protein